MAIASATDEGNSVAGFGPENAIDDQLDATSRWSVSSFPATLTLDLGGPRRIREVGIAWHLGDQRTSSFEAAISEDGTSYTPLQPLIQSAGDNSSFERYDMVDMDGQFVTITGQGNAMDNEVSIVEVAVFGCSLDSVAATPATVDPIDTTAFGLDINAAPGSNFELIDWALDSPTDLDNNGRSDRISETSLDTGFENEFFSTGADGGMVFKSIIGGPKTSTNTSFARSELREMLRRGDTNISTQGVNENNWILGYQPDPGQSVGGRGGVLRGTLAINQVTTTGDRNQVGRVIFGQIHADSDEPIRLYYRKYPENERGIIYFGHEIRGSDDIWFTVVGPEPEDINNQPGDESDPVDGIALNELFSYEIRNEGSRIEAIIRRGDQDGEIIGHNVVDMDVVNSGYDRIDEWMYFKAGAYTQNNTGDDEDFDLVTFYRLENSHD